MTIEEIIDLNKFFDKLNRYNPVFIEVNQEEIILNITY